MRERCAVGPSAGAADSPCFSDSRPQRISSTPAEPPMSTILVIVAVVLVVIVVPKLVQGVEETPDDPVDVAASASARERIVGTKRLERRAELDASQRPRAEKLWNRVRPKIDALVTIARARGIEVAEVDLGVQFDSASQSLHVQVDFSEADPEFLVWTEERSTGDSSGLQRVRQVRAMLKQVSEWVEGHVL